MFGKRYFAIRERLAEVVLGVGQLARKCGGEILDPVTDEGGGRSSKAFSLCCLR